MLWKICVGPSSQSGGIVKIKPKRKKNTTWMSAIGIHRTKFSFINLSASAKTCILDASVR
eukprot:TRINITY_DN7605_c0_g1_i1.p3 TRINITY_DN7605_c0_g1~~TRINITY_DN7605_c0_g1_i1.p3  ORF type:complete len:60 (-),score=2.40 TRINITY_DN7605_c0_g1_i1:160-339(-)